MGSNDIPIPMSGTDTDKTLDEVERIASIVLHLRDVSTSLSDNLNLTRR
jgi:hypothetical protein